MPLVRDYPEATSLEPTDAFIIDRVGVGTMFVEAFVLSGGGTSGVMIGASLPAGNTDDWAPDGYDSTVDAISITTDSGGSTLQGLTGGISDRRVILWNVGSGDLTIANQASDTPANVFYAPGYTDLVIPGGGGVTLVYDTTNLEAHGWDVVTPLNSTSPTPTPTPTPTSTIAFKIDGFYGPPSSGPFTGTPPILPDPTIDTTVIIDTNSACSIQTVSGFTGDTYVFTCPETGLYSLNLITDFFFGGMSTTNVYCGAYGTLYVGGSGIVSCVGGVTINTTLVNAGGGFGHFSTSCSTVVNLSAGNNVFFVWSNEPYSGSTSYTSIQFSSISGFKIG